MVSHAAQAIYRRKSHVVHAAMPDVQCKAMPKHSDMPATATPVRPQILSDVSTVESAHAQWQQCEQISAMPARQQRQHVQAILFANAARAEKI
jgi:hypothetical protein